MINDGDGVEGKIDEGGASTRSDGSEGAQADGSEGAHGQGAVSEDGVKQGDRSGQAAHDASQAEIERLQDALDDTRDALDQTRSELKEMTERLRTVSRRFREEKEGMEAFRTRLEERADKERARRKAEVVQTFFEPVQNLQRSHEAPGDAEALREGVRMVHHQFMSALKDLGLSRTPGAGARFDPNLHEALNLVQVDDASLDGCVVEVYDDGWMVDGRAIKAAKVAVGKHQASEPTPEA